MLDRKEKEKKEIKASALVHLKVCTWSPVGIASA